ncbi:MAG TPA: hypothetical protein PK079_03420 [Leptospiraceae bacterium]|nr:hypothetical protein [Leptospiraceae bacterium]HMW03804.1 hypothetical protein [Leptospiraceae bacterium]HMX34799.1 hypothetical protein [Leptospiraceae bacterium]HMY29784.1 hypothetical protein [Leptospiraceae bacterium]HMZ62817.1 hypothetical protein [Leptospiraceae bacterium]
MKLFILLFLFPILLFAEVIESYSKKSVQVGEESILEIKFQTGDVAEWSLPQKGFLFSESDAETPIGELKDITQTPTELKFTYVYFEAGKFSANVSWKTSSGETFKSKEELEVKSVLSGEKEPIDIAEPFVFSGSYILRLIGIILFGIGIISAFGYALFFFNNKKKVQAKDAIFEKLETEQAADYYKKQLQQLLLNTEISHKEFIFHLSGYIKERIGAKLDTSVFHLTQTEIHQILQDKYFVANIELLTIDNYFNSVKYMPNEEMITRENALSLIKYWEKILAK